MNDPEREQVRERYLKLNTAIICDVFDELELPMTALDNGITRRTFERQRVAGWAYPIEGRLMDERGADRLKLEVVDGVPSGSVTVWAGTDAPGIPFAWASIRSRAQRRFTAVGRVPPSCAAASVSRRSNASRGCPLTRSASSAIA